MKKILALILFTPLLLLVTACTPKIENPDTSLCTQSSQDGVYVCEKTYTSYFTTTTSIQFYLDGTENITIADVFSYSEDLLNHYHELLNRYTEFDGVTNIYTINHQDNQTTVISADLMNVIAFGLDNENTVQEDGVSLFNIALGPVLDIWHNARESVDCTTSIYYSTCPVPRDLIDGVTFNTNPDDVILDRENMTISFAKENMSLDLGGYGKGYVSELLSDYYDTLGLNYILNIGNSNVKAGGTNLTRDDGAFYIALERPSIELSYTTDYYAILKISADVAVVSSGNYQRFFIGSDDGLVYHHIIDPRTNYPGGDSMSVTILYEDGALADIYSTSIYLMSVSNGLAFVNSMDGLEAVWYLDDGTVLYSNGFLQYLYSFN